MSLAIMFCIFHPQITKWFANFKYFCFTKNLLSLRHVSEWLWGWNMEKCCDGLEGPCWMVCSIRPSSCWSQQQFKVIFIYLFFFSRREEFLQLFSSHRPAVFLLRNTFLSLHFNEGTSNKPLGFCNICVLWLVWYSSSWQRFVIYTRD